LAAAAVLGGLAAYGAAAALIVLAAAAGLMAWQGKRQLSVRHALESDTCIRGDSVDYAVSIRNRGLVPLAFVEAVSASSREFAGGSKVFDIALGSFAVHNNMASLSPVHRGIYTLSVGSVRLSDPFRLIDLNGRRPGPVALTVLPKLLPITEAWKQRLDPQGGGGYFSQSSDEPAVDSRVYRYGDSPRRIHWNLTARSRELMVRQYESIERRRLLVVLDLTPFNTADALLREDVLIESCLSVVRYALEHQIETMLVYARGGAVHNRTGHDIRAFDEIHRLAATLEFDSDIPAMHLLGEAKRAQMVYLFCAGDPDGATLEALPQDKPVELAVMRRGDESQNLPYSVGSICVTELEI
jgi:uncharacterized protein (DUF58 family)